MATYPIPDLCLVVLIGAAGAGKSTFATRHFAPDEVLSSDAYRALVSGDEADQSATRAAFKRLHHDLAQRLAAGRLTVVDATNVERAARRSLLALSRAAGCAAIAVVLDLPDDTVNGRNAGRTGRIVEQHVVGRHLERLRASLDGAIGLEAEGFASVIVLRDPAEVDQVVFARTAR